VVIPVTLRVAVVALVYDAPEGVPFATVAHVPPLLYCHSYVNGAVPIAPTVNDAFPEVTHILLSAGCVPMVTGTQEEVTVTVTVNVAPTQDPEVGVTVYVAVPAPEGIVKLPIIFNCGIDCALPPVTPPI
jgi:hypothetical protein